MDVMLDEMEGWQLAEWQAYEQWESEMDERSIMQARADAKVDAMQRRR